MKRKLFSLLALVMTAMTASAIDAPSYNLTKKPVGLLINFGASSLQGERYGYDEETNECILLDKNMRPVYD